MKLPTQERENILPKLIRSFQELILCRELFEISHVAQKYVKNLKEREKRRERKEEGKRNQRSKNAEQYFPLTPKATVYRNRGQVSVNFCCGYKIQ